MYDLSSEKFKFYCETNRPSFVCLMVRKKDKIKCKLGNF